ELQSLSVVGVVGHLFFKGKPIVLPRVCKCKRKSKTASSQVWTNFVFSSPAVLPYFRGSEVGYGDGHGPRWAEAQPGRAGHQHLRRCPPLRRRGQEGTRRGVAQAHDGHDL